MERHTRGARGVSGHGAPRCAAGRRRAGEGRLTVGGEGWRRRAMGEAGEREDLLVGLVEVEVGEGIPSCLTF